MGDDVVQLRPAGGPHEIHLGQALVIRPGDRLILRISSSEDAYMAENLRATALKRMPELADVVVICGVDELAVLRPEAGTDG